MSDMHGCEETTRRWPDTFDEVSPDELGDFIAHAEGCAYHTAAVRTAEEELLPRARAARALSGDGSILVGKNSDRAVAEHRQLMEIWREVAAKRELPFCRIALRHDGHEIARCDNFLHLINHDAVHELDAAVRLEVWGIITGDGVRVEARLGTYDLDRDTAKGEKFYEVGNGYRVGLMAREVAAEIFKVQFRCVESEKVTPARDGEQQTRAAAAGSGAIPVSGYATPGRKRPATRAAAEPKHRHPRAWPPPAPSGRTSLQIALGLLLVISVSIAAAGMKSAAVGKLRLDAAQKSLQAEAAEKRRQDEINKRRMSDVIERAVQSQLRDAKVGKPTKQSDAPRTDAANSGGSAGGMI